MSSSSPERPESHPENASPVPGATEPRLLTRRDRDADDAANGASRANAGRDGEGPLTPPPDSSPTRFRRRHFHQLRSLQTLRARIGANLRATRAARDTPGREDHTPAVRSPSLSPSRALRRLILSVLALAILGALALLTFALFLRHDMQAALPQLDGDLHLAGLTAPVTVTRDEQGVPNLQATTLNDLLFAQGFVTAQDRLWQMDALRRHGAGELAEILGSSMVEHDTQQRILQLRAAADRAVLTLPPDQLAQLNAYARGVNSFLESHADRLPVEFHLLHYTPAPWTPRDSLLVSLVMFQDLATTFPSKLRRDAFAQHLPPELLADLYPSRSWRDQPPTQPPPDLTAPRPEILQIPLDDTQVKLHAPSAAPGMKLATRVFGDHAPNCPECRAGSNNWAVSGAHSASGKPLVSNDMHLGLSVPDIWYEAGLHSTGSPTGGIGGNPGEPAFDVSGFTLPGVPFVIVGRNAHVAWSVTNLGGDVQDLRIEQLRGSGDTTEFQQPDGSWAPVAHHAELIRVRGGGDRTVDVLTTTAHIGGTVIDTPIISPLFPTEHRAISLLWTPYDPHNVTSPFYAVNAATGGAALVASLAGFGGPTLNLVYADDAGHIGYHAIGKIPVRGAPEHHPRPQLDNPLPANGQSPPDEDPANDNPGDNTQPDAQPGADPNGQPSTDPKTQPESFRSTTLLGRFLTAGYVRRTRRRTRSDEPVRVPLKPRPVKAAPDGPIQPLPAVRDYTIGQPIPSVPTDALDRSTEWSGYIPFEELPAIVDPADGVLATANARITPDDYPYFVANEWAPPYRVERIRKLLAGRTGLTPADMLAIETDTTSALDRFVAERLTYALDHASAKSMGKDARRLRQASDLLRNWGGGTPGNMTTDSPAAAIVSTARAEIWSMLLTRQIARHDHLKPTDSSLPKLAALYDWSEQTVVLENLLTFQPNRWLPPDFASWNDFLATAVARGIAAGGAPNDLSRWKYGSFHQVEIDHPIFSRSPLLTRVLGARTDTGAQSIGGDGTTILATGRSFGPSERFTADLAEPAATTGNITTGQSGNPASSHYLDQFPAWLHGTTFSMPLNGAPAQHTLRLLP